MTLQVEVRIESAGWSGVFPGWKKQIMRAAVAGYTSAKKPAALEKRPAIIGIILTDDRRIRRLNRDFRGFDKATNVLSFPQFVMTGLAQRDLAPFQGAIPLGDVVLSLPTLKREAKAEGKTLAAHVTHLTVHGVLHLLGYDHMTKKQAQAMEKLECDILESLGYPSPYAEHTPRHAR